MGWSLPKHLADQVRARGKGVAVNPAALPPAPGAPAPPADVAALAAAVVAAGYPAPAAEHRFCPGRRFRFDLAWVPLLVAFEREGGTWAGSRHTIGAGYRRDVEKYNLAAAAGWRVIRGTVDMMRDGTALRHLLAALAGARG